MDGQIVLQLGRMKCDRALPPLKSKPRPKRRVNSPGFDVRTALYYVVGLDLTEIEGISELTALTVISEIGPGVSRFATVKKFCSWLGLCRFQHPSRFLLDSRVSCPYGWPESPCGLPA